MTTTNFTGNRAHQQAKKPLPLWAAIIAAALVFLVYRYLLTHTINYAWLLTDTPAWWYEVLGRNTTAAVLYMQIIHSVGLIFASLPTAGLVVWLNRNSALLMAILIGCFLSIETTWHFSQFRTGIPLSQGTEISNIIDIIKFMTFLPLITWLAKKYQPGVNLIQL